MIRRMWSIRLRARVHWGRKHEIGIQVVEMKETAVCVSLDVLSLGGGWVFIGRYVCRPSNVFANIFWLFVVLLALTFCLLTFPFVTALWLVIGNPSSRIYSQHFP